MKPTTETATNRRMTEWMVAVVVLAMATPCLAQSASSQNASRLPARARTRRVVLVSIADRRLAVIEDGNVLA